MIGIEEISRTNHGGLGAPLHSDIVVPYIMSYGNDAQKQTYLPGCAAGDIVTAVAMTEPGAGSDLSSMTTTAEEDGGQLVINGVKTFISNGILCDLAIVAAKDPHEKNPHQAISLYLIEDGTSRFPEGPSPRQDGSCTARIRRNCFSPIAGFRRKTVWVKRVWDFSCSWTNSSRNAW